MLFLLMSALLLAGLATLGIDSLKISGSSALYPQILIGTSFVLLTFCSLQSWRKQATAHNDPELALLHVGTPEMQARFVVFCVIWLAYPVLMLWIGFTASTAAVLYGSAIVFRTKYPWLSLIGVIGFAALFAILLKSIIYVPVPEAWPDHLINRLMYRL